MNPSVTNSHNICVFRSGHSPQNTQGSFDTKSAQRRGCFNLIPCRIEWYFVRLQNQWRYIFVAKYYCLMATWFSRANMQSCQRNLFLCTNYFRGSGITYVLTETQNSPQVHFGHNKMPFPVICYISIFSTVIFWRSSNLTFDHSSKFGILILEKNTYIVCV